MLKLDRVEVRREPHGVTQWIVHQLKSKFDLASLKATKEPPILSWALWAGLVERVPTVTARTQLQCVSWPTREPSCEERYRSLRFKVVSPLGPDAAGLSEASFDI